MAYRQPFRSGLKDLAEGLLRQADAARRESEINAQKDLRLADIKSQEQMRESELLSGTIQSITNVGAQFFSNQAQQKAQEQTALWEANKETGERILGTISDEYARAQENYDTLLRSNADPQNLSNLRAIINDYRSIMTTPNVSDVPALYDQLMSRNYGQLTDRPTAREKAAGRGQVILLPGMRTSDILAISRVGANIAGTAMDYQMRTAESTQQLLANFDPSNPQSVWNARAALNSVGSFPPELQSLVMGGLRDRLIDFENSPEQTQMFDLAVASGIAGNEKIINDAWVLAQTRTSLVSRATTDAKIAFNNLSVAEGDQVINAYRTGMVSNLSPDQLISLARFVGVQPSELKTWSSNRSTEYQASIRAQQDLDTSVLNLSKENVVIAGQTVSLNGLRIEEAEWNKTRRVILANQEDIGFEEDLVTNIGSAAANDDVEVMNMYLEAFYNPSSLLGLKMRELFPDEVAERQLINLRDGAAERAGYRNIILRNDSAVSAIAYEQAKIDLFQNQQLSPFQTSALRAQYMLDQAQAVEDLRNLPFVSYAQTLSTFLEIAKSAPSSVWDLVAQDPNLMRQVNVTGLNLDYLRRISYIENWSTENPIREEAWNRFNVLMKTPPDSDQAKESMIAAANVMFTDMGLSDIERVGMENSLLAFWGMSDDETEFGRQGMATSLEDMTVSQMNNMAGMWSRVASSWGQQRGQYMTSQIAMSGCGVVISTNMSAPELASRKGNDELDGRNNGTTCGDVFAGYDEVDRQYQNALYGQTFWTNAAQNRVTPIPYSTGRAPITFTNQSSVAPDGSYVPQVQVRDDVDLGENRTRTRTSTRNPQDWSFSPPGAAAGGAPPAMGPQQPFGPRENPASENSSGSSFGPPTSAPAVAPPVPQGEAQGLPAQVGPAVAPAVPPAATTAQRRPTPPITPEIQSGLDFVMQEGDEYRRNIDPIINLYAILQNSNLPDSERQAAGAEFDALVIRAENSYNRDFFTGLMLQEMRRLGLPNPWDSE